MHQSRAIEDTIVHWAELGASNDKTALVLLHGMNDSHGTWKHVAPDLAGDRRVLMPDLPGYGFSDRPDASYELAWHAHIIARWIERLEIGPVDVLGHSFGGGVALMLLLEPALRIRRLVLVASGGLGTELGFVLRLATIPYVVELLGQPFMALGTRLALASSGYSKDDMRETSALNMKPGSARAFARTVRDIADWRGQRRLFYHRAHELQQLPPIAVFWGEHDRMIPVKHAKELSARADGVVVEIFPESGHYLHHDKADLLVPKLRDFLDQPNVERARFRREVPADLGSPPALTASMRPLQQVGYGLVRRLSIQARSWLTGRSHRARLGGTVNLSARSLASRDEQPIA